MGWGAGVLLDLGGWGGQFYVDIYALRLRLDNPNLLLAHYTDRPARPPPNQPAHAHARPRITLPPPHGTDYMPGCKNRKRHESVVPSRLQSYCTYRHQFTVLNWNMVLSVGVPGASDTL